MPPEWVGERVEGEGLASVCLGGIVFSSSGEERVTISPLKTLARSAAALATSPSEFWLGTEIGSSLAIAALLF